jgi:glycosyltransferase involved in cell wall biosynthesis
VPEAKLRVVGEGSDGDWLRQVAMRSRVDNMVEWIDRIPHNEMAREYQNSMAFIFPSLHDSGGMVVLEALFAGLPVICLDLGGPGSIVDSSCGFSLTVGQTNEEAIIEDLAGAMVRISTDHALRSVLAEGARKRAYEMTWNKAANALYSQLPVPDGKGNQVLV